MFEKSRLTQAHVEANDPRARFVGIDGYAAAGGYVLRDLFEEEHEGYLTDPALLDRLVTQKLEHEAETLRAEGWKWVEIEPEIDYQRLRGMARVHPEGSQPNPEQQAEIDRLTEAYDALVAEHGDEPPEAVFAEIEDLSDRIDALSAGTVVWDPEDVARAGAIVGIGHAGRVAIERGLVRREDEPVSMPASTSGDGGPSRSKTRHQKDGPAQLPDRLIEDLTAHRTAALRVALASNSEIALAAVIHAFALSLFYQYGADSRHGVHHAA